jgi:hypothetical protein
MRTIKLLVEATYDPELWTAKGVRIDIRDAFKPLEGIKVKVKTAPNAKNNS